MIRSPELILAERKVRQTATVIAKARKWSKARRTSAVPAAEEALVEALAALNQTHRELSALRKSNRSRIKTGLAPHERQPRW